MCTGWLPLPSLVTAEILSMVILLGPNSITTKGLDDENKLATELGIAPIMGVFGKA